MAMLLDGPPSTIEHLSERDSDLLAVAVSEGIDLTVKLQLASADIGMTIEMMLTPPLASSWRQAPSSLRHIAATPQLRKWHTYMTLRLIYQDLFGSRLNDRYQAKARIYRDEEARALEDLRTAGLGVVYDPLPQSPVPNVGSVQATDIGGTLYAATAFVNQRDEEGLMSVPVEIDTTDGTAAAVTIAELADNAIGWNLYAGVAPDALTKQNTRTLSPLAPYTLSPGRLVAGPGPTGGQRPNAMQALPQRISRG